MRVTENSNYDSIRNNILRGKERMEDLQRQSATMKKLNQPSDDPIGAAKVLELRTDKVKNDQYQFNAKVAESFLENTDHALSELSEIVSRAKEIAISQSSDPSSNESTRLGVSEEVTQLYKQSVAVANRRVGERYIFGGYKTQKPPVTSDGEYLGDEGQMMVEIASDVFLTMNVPGVDAFNTHPQLCSRNQGTYDDISQRNTPDDGQSNVNVFDELQYFRAALLTGSMENIHDTLERFDQINSKLISTRAKVGSRIQGLQSTVQAIERHNITNAGLSSSIEDADMAQVMSDLGKEEMVFRSSLASSKRLIQPTLLDFLK